MSSGIVNLSSYLILVGIYSSVISVSLDVGLRKSIRKSVEEHSKFLHSMGRAQMDQGNTGGSPERDQKI